MFLTCVSKGILRTDFYGNIVCFYNLPNIQRLIDGPTDEHQPYDVQLSISMNK